MAKSSCPKCAGYSFELKAAEPKGANLKHYFIQCDACGTVVGTTDGYDPAVSLKQQKDILADIQYSLKKIESYLGRLGQQPK